MTWPLAAGLRATSPATSAIRCSAPGRWRGTATHLGRGWWSANIFAPHPLALAYSEHFLPQGLQALPVYAATHNPILGYNLVFLSTFVALRARHVPARPRADRQPRGRLRRRPRVCLLALSHRVDAASAGAVVGLDAVGPLRPAASLRLGRARAPLAGARRRVVAAEPFVRLLPAVLQPDRPASTSPGR